MAEDKYDGCGVSTIWATSEKDPFFEACKIHDSFYSKGSPAQSLMTRKEADKILLNNMLKVANTPILKAKAYLFYGIVRALGGFYWEGK